MSATVTPLRPRSPPHNTEAEQELLGAIMVNGAVLHRVGDLVTAADFYEPVHGRIYAAALALHQQDRVVNPVTLHAHFEAEGGLPDGPVYLARLAAAATSVISAVDYARVIHDLAVRRRLAAFGTAVLERAHAADVETPVLQQIEELGAELDRVAGDRSGGEGRLVPIAEAIHAGIAVTERACQSGRPAGITTGLTDLDELTGGLMRSELAILAGRPSMGKTALAGSIAKVAAATGIESGEDVAFFSLEMGAEQLGHRWLSDPTSIPYTAMRTGRIEDDDLDRMIRAGAKLSTLPLHVSDRAGRTVAAIKHEARRFNRELNRAGRRLGLIVVDYLQLLKATSTYRGNRVSEVTEISQDLRAVAKDLGVAMLVLSQLSREVEKRDEKRPTLADLRESGAIEQDADLVMFVYREEYYLKRKEPPDKGAVYMQWQADMAKVKGICEVHVAKQRNGPPSIIRAHFDPAFARFRDLANTML